MISRFHQRGQCNALKALHSHITESFYRNSSAWALAPSAGHKVASPPRDDEFDDLPF